MSEEALQISEKRREVKGKGEKERCTHLSAEFQRIARRDKKAFLNDHCKEIEENNRVGKTRDLFKKIRDTKGTWITACLNQGNYESCHVVSPKMDGLLWRILTKGGLQRREWQTMPAFLPEEIWTEVCDHCAVIKTIPRKKKCKKAKWLSEEAL